MALIKCEECGKEISSTAKACPHCGKHIIKNNPGQIILAIFAGIIFYLIFIGLFN